MDDIERILLSARFVYTYFITISIARFATSKKMKAVLIFLLNRVLLIDAGTVALLNVWSGNWLFFWNNSKIFGVLQSSSCNDSFCGQYIWCLWSWLRTTLLLVTWSCPSTFFIWFFWSSCLPGMWSVWSSLQTILNFEGCLLNRNYFPWMFELFMVITEDRGRTNVVSVVTWGIISLCRMNSRSLVWKNVNALTYLHMRRI